MAVTNIRKKRIHIYIPPAYTSAFKITMEDADGTVDDVTNKLSRAVVTDEATNGIGGFELDIWDPNETYAHLWVGNEIFRYYKDYDVEANTLRFRGRIEKPSKRGNKLNVKGRREDVRVQGVKVTKSYDGIECSIILKDLINSYAAGFTYANVNASTTTLTVSWYEKPLWDCIKELCTVSGFECFVDAELDFHFFESGTSINTTEGIVHDFNLLEVRDFTLDLTQVRNKIKVYGATLKGVQELYTTSQTIGDYSIENFGERVEIINDKNITSHTQAKEIAESILADKQNPPVTGSVVSAILLATIKPGDSIRISSPQNNITPDDYVAISYKDDINIEGRRITTTVNINKEPRRLSHVLKDRIESENMKKDTFGNPEGMDYSFNFLFESDSGTHTSTEVTEGVLKLQSGEATGTWVSPNSALNGDLSECFLVMTGETLTSAAASVSGDGGVNYHALNNRQKSIISTDTGSNIRVKVVIDSADTQIESLSVLYKIT